MPLGGSSFRGFPFDEEESGAWSSLAARHPDIAARLRQRPATWARKRRPSSQDATDDFGDTFGSFDRFPFDDIPPEFRDSFPSHWGRRFEEPQPSHAHQQQQQQQQPQSPQPAPQSPQPQQASAGTQTETAPTPHLPQYGLRNTVDLGQRSAADPSVDAEERGPRSMSAPPEARPGPAMSAPHPHPRDTQQQQQQPAGGTVRHIPIFVEGRDEPVINKSVDHGAQFADTKPAYVPPPQHQPHIDREQYFADDGPASFHHPPNFSRAFGTPFNKGFRQGPQPFTQQKAYPQTAFARGASPQRSQSPKQPHPEEPFVKTHHEPRGQPHPQQQQQQHQYQQPPQQQQQQPPQPQPHAPSPPPKQQPTSNDPITVILAIQTDVLNLMSEVENFTGTKKDKKYMYLDEMLTRNLIKLDNIETEGKDNIRQARKEAIKCIQKCIAVLEAKAESNANPAPAPAQAAASNGEVDMKEDTKEDAKAEENVQEHNQNSEPADKVGTKPEAEEAPQPPDTRPAETRAVLVENKPEQETDKQTTPKKKVVKKRDKSKDNTPSNKEGDSKPDEKLESMQVDEKGDQVDSQKMEVDGASASQ